jgi:nicotinate phosphoribosyltransferase
LDSSIRPVGVPGVAPADLRAGFYSDAYFLNAARILERCARSGDLFHGDPRALRERVPVPASFRPGDAEVEMQFFSRRGPRFVAAGLPFALGVLRDGGRRVRGASRRRSPPRVLAIPEGTLTRPLDPALVVRGRYRDFAHLETPILGLLTRCSRIATNVYEALVASRGKPILFFPARFDLPQCQPLDGYAYRVGVEAFGRQTGTRVPVYVSTDAQGALWNERGGGTVPHAFVLCWLGDTAEALLAFCRHAPASVKRVALVDTTNDCVGESVRTARRLFEEHLRLLRAGRPSEARRFVLHAVRADTSPDLRDRSVPPSRDPRLTRGVTPVLIKMIRRALDRTPVELGLAGRWRSIAERYFRAVRIVATGGFHPAKIRFFEAQHAPVDMYGVGSHFLRGESNDYTADVVRVRIGGRFRIAAKTGRAPRANPDLRPVRLGRAGRGRSR